MIFFNLPDMKSLGMLFLIVAIFSGCDRPDPIPEDTRLTVYPNPVAGPKAYALVVSSGPIILRVFDPQGRNAWTFNISHGGTFDIPTNDIGTYYLHLKIGDDEITRTLVRK
jgi:hypothetical protein